MPNVELRSTCVKHQLMNGAPRRLRRTRGSAAGQTHDALVNAAHSVLSRLGYQGATLDRIAAEAGYTKGAVYWHFKNKEALFLELLARGLRQNLEDLDQILADGDEDPRQLQQEVSGYIDRQAQNAIPLLALELEIESRRNPSLAAVFVHVIARHQAAITNMLDRYYAIVGRDPPMPLDQLAAFTFAFAEGFALRRQTRPDQQLDFPTAMKILLGVPRDA